MYKIVKLNKHISKLKKIIFFNYFMVDVLKKHDPDLVEVKSKNLTDLKHCWLP